VSRTEHQADLYLSTLSEYVEVLGGKLQIRAAFPAARSERTRRKTGGSREVDIFLDALIALAEPVETHFMWRPQLRDPGDEMVLEAAVNGGADALVTFNGRDFGIAPSLFGVEVLLPREAIRRVKP
jgi:hypothetical protein